jgi:hypothetical protein
MLQNSTLGVLASSLCQKTCFTTCAFIVMSVNIDNVQGDVWSKGFKKLNETYYFFRITAGKELDFSQSLKVLMQQSPTLISNLAKAKETRQIANGTKINDGGKAEISNALIAFTFRGLKTVSLQRKCFAQLTLLDSKILGGWRCQSELEQSFRYGSGVC